MNAVRILASVAVVAASACLILAVSERRTLLYAYEERVVAFEGDIIVTATEKTNGPGYGTPFVQQVCIYWAGVRTEPILAHEPCPRFA
jgi:hypothetical protein